ncbi:CRISPR system precrRNA processing endoribonuclease RAMP protein Cas6 [Deinococcus antarcticus]|uniref:CRISPR system precrRNA processing endoribonuclease RAMP protein Cas6 n=1 Tax=Deinococcus antarcticus TaxID=1298767 RepID=A0ABV8ABR3_9DEIO
MPPFDLPFAVLRVTLTAREMVQLPPFPGSKLEGAFGRALYQLACTQPQRETCRGCPLHGICPYGLSYAPSLPPEIKASSLGTPPRPIVFRVAYGEERYVQPGEELTFGMVVIGHALTQLPYLLAALREVGVAGLGRTRGQLDLQEVVSVQPYSGQEVTLLSGNDIGVNLTPIILRPADLPGMTTLRIRVHLRSLLHLKQGGQMVEDIQFSVLIRALQRRIGNLEQVHGGAASLGADFGALPGLAHSIQTIYQYLRPASQLRKGSRPREKTSMEGLLGTLEYAGDFTSFAPLLRLGEQLGIGKWAHFGAGLYDIEELA